MGSNRQHPSAWEQKGHGVQLKLQAVGTAGKAPNPYTFVDFAAWKLFCFAA
jgi:hypothetical protein